MSKYDALEERLQMDPHLPVTLELSTIDRLVGGLPKSAREHRAWWANERAGTHRHARAWLNTGRKVVRVDFNVGVVEFSARSPADERP